MAIQSPSPILSQRARLTFHGLVKQDHFSSLPLKLSKKETKNWTTCKGLHQAALGFDVLSSSSAGFGGWERWAVDLHSPEVQARQDNGLGSLPLPSLPLTWHLTSPYKRNMIFQVPSHRCYVEGSVFALQNVHPNWGSRPFFNAGVNPRNSCFFVPGKIEDLSSSEIDSNFTTNKGKEHIHFSNWKINSSLGISK